MFVSQTKAVLTQALIQVFQDSSFLPTNFNALHIDIEYPINDQDYPGVWVDFDVSGQVSKGTIAGPAWGILGVDGRTVDPTYLWRFEGTAEYTALALSSLERDNLVDELIKIVSIHDQVPYNAWNQYLITQDFINIQVNLDNVGFAGKGQSQGTPWQTDEIIYEQTLTYNLIGEFFASTPYTTLVPLDRIVVIGTDNEGNEHRVSEPPGF